MKIGINTFGLSDLMLSDFEGTLDKLKQIGFDAIEPCIFFTGEWGDMGKAIKDDMKKRRSRGGIWADEEANSKVRVIKEKGFEVNCAQLQMLTNGTELLEKAVPEAIAFAKEYGISSYVLSYRIGTIKEMKAYMPALKNAVKSFRDNGINVLYHNHEIDLLDDHGDTVFDYILREIPELNIELDIGWVKFAGRDCVQWMKRYQDRISILHIKDVRADACMENRSTCFTAIGEGSIPLKEILKESVNLKLSQVPYIIDQDNSEGDMIRDLTVGIENIRKQMIS